MIYGVIGADVDAQAFAREVAAIDGDLSVRINSPGGDLYAGLAIMNALRSHPGHVTTVIEGMAASAASFIAIGGGDTVIARPHSELMIHDAISGTSGNAAEMRRMVADLDRVSESMARIYAEKSGVEAQVWRERMLAETWFTAEEAKRAGLVDEVADARDGKSAKALVPEFSMSAFHYPGRASAPAPVITAPEGHNHKEVNMAFLNAVAHKLGINAEDMTEDQILAALDEVLAEQSENPGAGELPAKVEIAYPTGSTVVPTGTVTISPEGETPADVTFSVADAPDGWTAEVDENSGSLTVTAPDGAAVDDEVELTVTAETADGESTDLVVKVTVASASDSGDDSKAPADPPAPGDGLTTTVDSARLAELEALAEYGRKAKELSLIHI